MGKMQVFKRNLDTSHDYLSNVPICVYDHCSCFFNTECDRHYSGSVLGFVVALDAKHADDDFDNKTVSRCCYPDADLW
uniref:Uncharacterized protein n=1 Tax=Acrobeloides nanus TaxID=290746 RepID=A0A914DH13_9BILA